MPLLRRQFQIGLLCVAMEYEGEDCDAALAQMDALTKPMQGLARREDIELMAKLLNGPTLDERLSRPVRPCGCRDKTL